MKMLIIALLLLSPLSHASDWHAWRSTGKATLKWGPFTLYDSQLYTPDGRYQPQRWPLALVITYRRNISHQDLVEATGEQWQILNTGTAAQRRQWLAQLNGLWPDVTEGSRLAFRADRQGGQFYMQEPGIASPIRALGKPFDATFRDAFLAIWLSPDTPYPDIRQALIGGS